MTEKKSFQMYRSNRAAMDSLSDEDRGKLLRAIFAYEDGEEVELSGMLQTIFLLMTERLDSDRERYAETCARNRANGMKGGRPSKSGESPETDGSAPENGETEENPREPGGISVKPKKPDTDTDMDMDTDTDMETDCVYKRGGAPPTHTASSKPRFQKPSLDDVKAYCAERGCGVDAQRFVDFYESKGWMVGKSPMRDWRASVRLWEQDARGEPGKNNDEVIEYKYSVVL